jgi:catechol 2,3-dioxygenase-like lactoylglutathione lyase family enzyme
VKPKSVSGVTCYVKNLSRSIKFYETLGFTFRKKERDRATAYLNWFWIDLRAVDKEPRPAVRKDASRAQKGAGVSLCVSVDDADAFHKDLRARGLKPSAEPHDSPWGDREFVILDPDGYKLVVFARTR